jgi:hypothetical protein
MVWEMKTHDDVVRNEVEVLASLMWDVANKLVFDQTKLYGRRGRSTFLLTTPFNLWPILQWNYCHRMCPKGCIASHYRFFVSFTTIDMASTVHDDPRGYIRGSTRLYSIVIVAQGRLPQCKPARLGRG